MTNARIVLSTAGSKDEAEKIGKELVERRLAACVNIVPQVRSIYRWEGKIEQSEELLLVIKTTADRYPAVQDAIKELHSYVLPECVCLAVEDGSKEYVGWIVEATQQSQTS